MLPKKRRATDAPMAHKEIEKRRRDRMNESYTMIEALLPGTRANSAHNLVKVEVLRRAIQHIKNAHSKMAEAGGTVAKPVTSPSTSAMSLPPSAVDASSAMAVSSSTLHQDEVAGDGDGGGGGGSAGREFNVNLHRLRGIQDCIQDSQQLLIENGMPVRDPEHVAIMSRLESFYSCQESALKSHKKKKTSSYGSSASTTITSQATAADPGNHLPVSSRNGQRSITELIDAANLMLHSTPEPGQAYLADPAALELEPESLPVPDTAPTYGLDLISTVATRGVGRGNSTPADRPAPISASTLPDASATLPAASAALPAASAPQAVFQLPTASQAQQPLQSPAQSATQHYLLVPQSAAGVSTAPVHLTPTGVLHTSASNTGVTGAAVAQQHHIIPLIDQSHLAMLRTSDAEQGFSNQLVQVPQQQQPQPVFSVAANMLALASSTAAAGAAVSSMPSMVSGWSSAGIPGVSAVSNMASTDPHPSV
ncbi:polyhomeotic-like protein 2 [Sycon ciliatum]|uniref:polyhomeotic-like protein 2 n=1 Tax=Sycon ciliatum TaxID=27933 RepID=UPI0031F6466C